MSCPGVQPRCTYDNAAWLLAGPNDIYFTNPVGRIALDDEEGDLGILVQLRIRQMPLRASLHGSHPKEGRSDLGASELSEFALRPKWARAACTWTRRPNDVSLFANTHEAHHVRFLNNTNTDRILLSDAHARAMKDPLLESLAVCHIA